MSTKPTTTRTAQASCGQARASALLLGLVALLAAGPARASVALSGTWTRVAGVTSGNPSGTFAKPTTGTNRVIVVVVDVKLSTAATTFAPTVTYGGQTVTEIVSTDTSSRQKVWIGYVNEAGIAAATSTTLAVSGLATNTNAIIWAAVYTGVDQTSSFPAAPYAASAGSTTGVTPITAGPVNWVTGGATIYATNMTGATTMTQPAGSTERYDQAETTNMESSGGDIARAANGSGSVSATPSTTGSYGIVVASFAPVLPKITIGNATAGEAATVVAPGAGEVALDAFTLTPESGTASVSSVTVAMPVGSAALVGSLTVENTQACNQPTPYGTVTNPATDTVTINTTSLSVSAATSLWICMAPKAHANMPAVPGSQVAVTGQVTAVAATGYTQAGSDGVSQARTIDNKSPSDPAWGTISAFNGQVVLNWTNPADADFSQVVILRSGTTISAVPVEGTTYAVGNALSGATVVYVGSAQTFTDATVTNGSTYYYKAFARDASGNYSTPGAQTGPQQPVVVVATTTVGNGSDPAGVTVAPGAVGTPVDAFTLATNFGSDQVSSITVTLPYGVYPVLESATLQNTASCNMATPLATISDPNASVTFPVSITATATPATYYVCVKPRAHTAMPAPPGAAVSVTARVSSIGSSGSYQKSMQDTSSATVVVDNLSPRNATFGAITPGSAQVTLNWTNPADADFSQVIVVRKIAGPVDGVPVEGQAYAVGGTIGTSTVRYVGNLQTFLDNVGLTNGQPTYYAIYAMDSRGNYAVGVSYGPVYPGSNPLAVGDTTAGSTKPVVSIVNPMRGAVVGGTFRVQVRATSPSAAITGVQVTTNPQAATPTWQAANRISTTAYGTTGTDGIWELQLAPAAGSFTLVARASNDGGASWINSAPVGVTVKTAGTGDGNLLVRDNASQICTDCHAMATHGSSATGTKYGSWTAACRDCHTPHGTTNIYLVPNQVTPPPVGASVPGPKTVHFSTKSGYSSTGGATNKPAASYANADGTGPCQVCHTRTKYYLSNGTQVTHNPNGDCATCHKHTKGLGAVCTDCHGTAGRTGTVVNVAAAPPTDTNKQATGVRVGAHLAHVTQTNLRDVPLECSECHPAANDHNGTRDAAWSILGTGNGAVAPSPAAGNGAYSLTWETTPTCSNYCHGASLKVSPNAGGGSIVTPSWIGSNQAACGTCHGAPPPVDTTAEGNHPQNASCSDCHGTGYATTGLAAAAKPTHIDGTLQKPANGCTACHGALAGLAGAAVANTDPSAAPGQIASAEDTHGNTARTAVGVGAHIKHVNTGLMSAKSCNVCHGTVPATGDTVHANGTVAAGFTGPAVAFATATPVAYDAAFQTAPSCTNSCHSNAAPLGGTLAKQTVSWTSTTAMTCTSCHGTGGATSTLSAKHQKHTNATTYGFACVRCHSATANAAGGIGNAANHVNGVKNVAFDATPVNQTTVSYTGTTTAPNYTCNTSYCHSQGTATAAPFTAPARATLNWQNGTANADCADCHGGNSAAGVILSTGSHTAHINQAAFLGTTYGCVTCHSATASADRTISTYSNHLNGVKNVTATSWSTTAKTCASNYCHSSGQATPVYYTATWGTALANDCRECHGRSTDVGATVSQFGEPNYPSGGAGTPTANSHAKHVGSAASCANCHGGTTTNGTTISGPALHINNNRDVTIAATYDTNGATANYVQSTKTCSGISCHGSGSPVWGGAAQTCTSCHGITGTEVTDLGATFWKNNVTATINTTEWTYSGHGRPTASGVYPVTGNSAAAFPTAPTPGTSECVYCHDGNVGHQSDTNPFRLRGPTNGTGVSATYDVSTTAGANAVCLNCHSLTANGVDPDGATTAYTLKTATTTKVAMKAHVGAKHTLATLGGKFCWDCHDPHGDSTTATGNAAMIRKNVTAVSDGTYGYVGASGVQRVVTFNSEAGSPPAVGKVVEGVNAGTQRVGVCQACHAATNDTPLAAPTAWTKYWNRLGYDDPDGVGGTAPAGSTHNASSTTTPYCISCHTHATGFGGECVGCHATTQPINNGPLAGQSKTRRNVVDEFKKAWSHKRSTSPTNSTLITVTNADCTVCHMEGDAATATPSSQHGDGYIDLRDPDSGNQILNVTFSGGVNGGTDPGKYTEGTTAVRFPQFSRNLTTLLVNDPNASTLQAIMISQCLKCHDSNGAVVAFVPGGSATNPFKTTVTYTTTPTSPSGVGVTAGGVSGGVIDVNESFKTTNSSYHPILGKQNDWYAKDTRMAAPWDMGVTTRSGTVNATTWGPLMSCWDCHADPADPSTITYTVTAHGGAATIRGTATVSGTPSATTAVTLCVKCHKSYDTQTNATHGTGSAFSSTGDSGMTSYMRYGCNICHSSGYSTAVTRPTRAADSHGVNAIVGTGTKTNRWAQATTNCTVGVGGPACTAAQVDTRPYAFIRNLQQLADHTPKQIGSAVWSSTNCNMRTSPCSQGTKSYTAGGTF